MDRDRYKKKSDPTPQKRSINSEEIPLQAYNLPQNTVPSQPKQSKAIHKDIAKNSNSVKEVPILFDGTDDDDIFGIWATQKKLKKERQEQENREKAAKIAAKILKKQKKHANKTKNNPRDINISISLPKTVIAKKINFSKLKTYLKPPKGNKKIYYNTVGLIAVPVLVLSIALLSNLINQDSNSTDTTAVQGQVATKPEFAIVTASGIDNATTKYDTEKKVASYADKIEGTNIVVSQQQLPDSLKTDLTKNLKNLAEQFSATDVIPTKGNDSYLGTSAKGPQTVIIVKKDLLIFIKSDQKIDKKIWQQYIDSME